MTPQQEVQLANAINDIAEMKLRLELLADRTVQLLDQQDKILALIDLISNWGDKVNSDLDAIEEKVFGDNE